MVSLVGAFVNIYEGADRRIRVISCFSQIILQILNIICRLCNSKQNAVSTVAGFNLTLNDVPSVILMTHILVYLNSIVWYFHLCSFFGLLLRHFIIWAFTLSLF